MNKYGRPLKGGKNQYILGSYRLSIPCLKCLEPEIFQISDFFGVFWKYLLIHSWGMGPSLNTKFIREIYIYYYMSKVNFIQYFQCTCVLTVTCHMKSGIEFFMCEILLALRIFRFQKILDFWIRDASTCIKQKLYLQQNWQQVCKSPPPTLTKGRDYRGAKHCPDSPFDLEYQKYFFKGILGIIIRLFFISPFPVWISIWQDLIQLNS